MVSLCFSCFSSNTIIYSPGSISFSCCFRWHTCCGIHGNVKHSPPNFQPWLQVSSGLLFIPISSATNLYLDFLSSSFDLLNSKLDWSKLQFRFCLWISGLSPIWSWTSIWWRHPGQLCSYVPSPTSSPHGHCFWHRFCFSFMEALTAATVCETRFLHPRAPPHRWLCLLSHVYLQHPKVS